MKCKEAEIQILMQDSGELPADQVHALTAHLHDCKSCQEFQFTLIESQVVYAPEAEPSAAVMQNILRESRINAPKPEKKIIPLFSLKPVLAMAASLVIGLGIFLTASNRDKVGMELVVTETQMLNAEDQLASVMYDGFSEDDLAFNFLMTYEEI